MFAYRRSVVVGVDGAEPGWRALAWAEAEATVRDSRLVVCRAVDPHGRLAVAAGSSTPGWLETADPTLARALAGVRARLGGDRVSLILAATAPVAGLVRAAADADLVVVGAPDSLDRVGAG